MRKKVLVVGHESSGTHFLINTIAQCFGYEQEPISLVHTQGVDWRDPQAFRNWIAQYRGRFVPHVFKSHHAYPFFAPLLNELGSEFAVFYIQRDGRDVMTSFWTYLNRIPGRGWGPKCATVGSFMRAPSTGGFTQFQFEPDPATTMLERWVDHIEGWNGTRLPIHRVTYEWLQTDYESVLDTIAEAIHEHPIVRTRPTMDAPSSLPWKGRIGTWQEYFTEADEGYFRRTASRGPMGRVLPRRIRRVAGRLRERLFYRG
jgi:hypothetical protein